MSDSLLRKQQQRLLTLWPAIKGSLALVHKPCIRPRCPVCARGRKHPAYILAFTQGGKRRCMYVPKELVPRLRKYLKNGRQLEKLLSAAGPLILKAHRQAKAKS